MSLPTPHKTTKKKGQIYTLLNQLLFLTIKSTHNSSLLFFPKLREPNYFLFPYSNILYTSFFYLSIYNIPIQYYFFIKFKLPTYPHFFVFYKIPMQSPMKDKEMREIFNLYQNRKMIDLILFLAISIANG